MIEKIKSRAERLNTWLNKEGVKEKQAHLLTHFRY